MADRFFLDHPPQGDAAQLAAAEAHHLIHVLRARPGQLVTLFDGSGWEFEARVERLGRQHVELTVLARRQVDRELARPLVLGVGLPRGDRQRSVLEKAVELGVARLVPLETRRGVAEASPSALERLRRGVIDASKQCGRNRLMQVGLPASCEAFLQEPPPGAVRLLGDPSGEADSRRLWQLASQPDPGELWLAVGPEGGFAPEELALARQQGWTVVALGPRILRVETAVAALVALAGAAQGETGAGSVPGADATGCEGI